MTDKDETEKISKDTFEIAFRVLGNEIFGMTLVSHSRVRNWAVFGVVVLIALTIMVSELAPAFESIFTLFTEGNGNAS